MRLITWIHPRGSGTLLILPRRPFEDDIQAFPSLPTKTSNFQFYWNEKFSIKGKVLSEDGRLWKKIVNISVAYFLCCYPVQWNNSTFHFHPCI